MNLWPMPPATSGTRQQSPRCDGEPMWSVWKASPLRHALACPHRTHRELQCHPVHWYLPTGMANRSDRSKKIILLLRSRWVKMGQEFSAVCDPKSCDTVTRFSSSTLSTLLPVPADVWLCFSAMHWALDQLFSSLLLFAFSSSSQHLPVHRKTRKTQSVWRKAAPLPLYNLYTNF